MAQQDYGVAQPIADFFRKGKKEEKPAPKKVDTSYHDAMVKRANESFSKSDSGIKIANTSQSQGKTIQKPKTPKRMTGKR